MSNERDQRGSDWLWGALFVVFMFAAAIFASAALGAFLG